jgi:aryl-alcohol dehydrogenase-like predicted oxidoreductase
MNLKDKTKGISKLGLGCVTFGREINKDASFELMDYAFSKGINFFDTATAYGAGVSEQIVGTWLVERALPKNSLVIATKILPPYDALHIRRSVEESLQRLRIESIDILYLHRWDELLNQPQAWQELDNLVREGKVKELGASNFNSKYLAYSLDMQKKMGAVPIKYIQNNHNLAVSDLSTSIRQICEANDIKIITYSPLGAGFLSGKHKYKVEPGSRFDVMPAHQNIYFTEDAQKRLEKLLHVAASTGYSATHLALAWAIHQSGISSVLVGGRTLAHLDQAFEAAEFYAPELFKMLEGE